MKLLSSFALYLILQIQYIYAGNGDYEKALNGLKEKKPTDIATNTTEIEKIVKTIDRIGSVDIEERIRNLPKLMELIWNAFQFNNSNNGSLIRMTPSDDIPTIAKELDKIKFSFIIEPLQEGAKNNFILVQNDAFEELRKNIWELCKYNPDFMEILIENLLGSIDKQSTQLNRILAIAIYELRNTPGHEGIDILLKAFKMNPSKIDFFKDNNNFIGHLLDLEANTEKSIYSLNELYKNYQKAIDAFINQDGDSIRIFEYLISKYGEDSKYFDKEIKRLMFLELSDYYLNGQTKSKPQGDPLDFYLFWGSSIIPNEPTNQLDDLEVQAFKKVLIKTIEDQTVELINFEEESIKDIFRYIKPHLSSDDFIDFSKSFKPTSISADSVEKFVWILSELDEINSNINFSFLSFSPSDRLKMDSQEQIKFFLDLINGDSLEKLFKKGPKSENIRNQMLESKFFFDLLKKDTALNNHSFVKLLNNTLKENPFLQEKVLKDLTVFAKISPRINEDTIAQIFHNFHKVAMEDIGSRLSYQLETELINQVLTENYNLSSKNRFLILGVDYKIIDSDENLDFDKEYILYELDPNTNTSHSKKLKTKRILEIMSQAEEEFSFEQYRRNYLNKTNQSLQYELVKNQTDVAFKTYMAERNIANLEGMLGILENKKMATKYPNLVQSIESQIEVFNKKLVSLGLCSNYLLRNQN
jgi:hypothetical protein